MSLKVASEFEKKKAEVEQLKRTKDEMDTQYRHQFLKLGEELTASRMHSEQLEKKIKMLEAQISQSSEAVATLEVDKAKLEVRSAGQVDA